MCLSVYNLVVGQTEGMAGVDFAFYRNRAVYHTLLDSIRGMGQEEGKKALWAMMDAVRGAGLAMLNENQVGDDNEGGVYFDCESQLGFPRCFDIHTSCPSSAGKYVGDVPQEFSVCCGYSSPDSWANLRGRDVGLDPSLVPEVYE